MKQTLDFEPNFSGKLLLRHGEFRRVSFPKSETKTISFRGIPSSVKVQNSSNVNTGYFKVVVYNGLKAVTSRTLYLRKRQVRKLSDFGTVNVNSEADNVRFYVFGNIQGIITLDDGAAFEVEEDLPETDLRVEDVRSTSMTISWKGEEFPDTLFRVVLSSLHDTKEFTTYNDSLHATGLRDDTAYKVQLYKVEK